MTRLLGTQITAEAFAKLATQPFKKLFRLSRERDELVKDAGDIAVSQEVAWLSLPYGNVPSSVYLKELERYEPLLRSIERQKQGHDKCVEALTVIRLLCEISAVLMAYFL